MAQFFKFSQEGHVPQDFLLRSFDRLVDRAFFRARPATESFKGLGHKDLQTYRPIASKPRKPDCGKVGFIRDRVSKSDCYVCHSIFEIRDVVRAYEKLQLAATAQNLHKLAKLIPDSQPPG